LLIVVVPFLIPVLLTAGTVNLAQTGETTCYDSAGTLIACDGTGQDGDIRAGVPWPDPRFTDIGDGTIRDNLTGLVWTQDAKISCTSTGPNWSSALVYVAGMNSGVNPNFGYTDWRLPNALEMLSLSHQGEYYTGEWLESQGFTNVGTYASSYWTSTSWVKSPDRAWLFNLYNFPWSGDKDAETYCFWPVRAGQQGAADPTYPANIWKTGQTTCYNNAGTIINCANTGQDGEKQAGVAWPVPRIIDNADGTFTDNLTGLTWLTTVNSALMTWQESLDHANTLSDSSTTYRLPNTNEAMSLQSFTLTPTMSSTGPCWTNNSVNIADLNFERYAPVYDDENDNDPSTWAEQMKIDRAHINIILNRKKVIFSGEMNFLVAIYALLLGNQMSK